MKNKGFTLIEIMVVIAITALIGGMVLANMRSGGEVIDLKNSAQKLTEIIKQAQMMAYSGKQINGQRADYGYGVYVNDVSTPSSYKLFINDNNGTNYAYSEGDTIIKEFHLSNNIYLDAVDHYFVIFVPPGRPPGEKTYVGTTTSGSLLKDSGGRSLVHIKHKIGRSAYIRINSQGRINLLESL